MHIEWEELRELLTPQLNTIKDEIRKTGKVTNQQACDLKLLSSIIEKSYTIEMFEENDGFEEESYGRRAYGARRGRRRGSYQDGWDRSRSYGYYENPMAYNHEYSGHTEHDVMKSQLHSMMQASNDPVIRKALQGAMDELK